MAANPDFLGQCNTEMLTLEHVLLILTHFLHDFGEGLLEYHSWP